MAICVDLGPDTEDYVAHLVATGVFPSQGEVVAAGIRMLKAQSMRAELDAAIEDGIAAADAGRLHPIENVRSRLQRMKNAADASGT